MAARPIRLAQGEVEVGWSPRSTSHVVVGRGPGSMVFTACGKSLSGLADSLWLRVAVAERATGCARCVRLLGAVRSCSPE